MIFDVTLTQLWGIHCVRMWRERFFIFISMIASDALTLNNEHINIPEQALLPAVTLSPYSGSFTWANKKILIIWKKHSRNEGNTCVKNTSQQFRIGNMTEKEKSGEGYHGQEWRPTLPRCHAHTSIKISLFKVSRWRFLCFFFSIPLSLSLSRIPSFEITEEACAELQRADENAVCLHHSSHKLKRAPNK